MQGPYSNEVKEMTIAPECPWYEAQQTLGAPNVNWCEPTTCAYINEPANTWSNIPYILIGIIIYKKFKRSEHSYFGITVFFMGLFSFIYHATNNYLTQYFDFIGMFLMMSYVMSFELQRLSKRYFSNFYATFWCLVFLNNTFFMLCDIYDSPVQKLMLINAFPIITIDLYLGWKAKILNQYKEFILSAITLIIAQGFAIMDIQRIYCNPENLWFHGHVMWHLVASVSMIFIALHMRKISRYPVLFAEASQQNVAT